MQPTLRGARLNDDRFTRTGLSVGDADALVPDLLEFADQPRKAAEIEAWLEARLGVLPKPGVWWALRSFAPLLHAPIGDRGRSDHGRRTSRRGCGRCLGDRSRPRSRVIPADYRKLVARPNGDVLPTLLVDGYVAGVWRPVERGIEATAFHRLPVEAWVGDDDGLGAVPAESGAADCCAVHGAGHVQIVLICTFTQAAGRRVVEVAPGRLSSRTDSPLGDEFRPDRESHRCGLIRGGIMPEHRTGSREEWQAAREELARLEAEQARRDEEIKAKRLDLPWVPVDKEYQLGTAEGTKTLAELFDGRSQLLAYNIMFGPDFTLGACPGWTG